MRAIPTPTVVSVATLTGQITLASLVAQGLAPLASPAFTGVPTAPTAAPATNTTQLATTAFVLANAPSAPVSSVFTRTGAVVATSGDYSVGQITGAAPTASPTFSGTITLGAFSGLLKGTAGVVSAATAGTDYLLPSGSGAALTGITVGQVSGAAALAGATFTGAVVHAETAGTGTQSPSITVTGPAHTALTASTEYIDLAFNLNRTVQFATGPITTQRAAVFQAPTYSFVGASTITTAATLAISGAPVAGTNATITNPYALWVQGGLVNLSGNAIISTVYGSTSSSGNLTLVSTTNATLGKVFLGSSGNCFWDDTNGRLSLGNTGTTFSRLEVQGGGVALVGNAFGNIRISKDSSGLGMLLGYDSSAPYGIFSGSGTNSGFYFIANVSGTNFEALRIVGGTAYIGINTGTNCNAQLQVNSSANTTIGFIIQGAASQTAVLQSLKGISSTSTARDIGYLDAGFSTSTDASYKGFLRGMAQDFNFGTNPTGREGWRVGTNGTAALLGFFGATPVVQQSGDVATSLVNLGLITSGTYGKCPVAIFDDITDVSNVTTTETTLYSNGIGAARLTVNQDKILTQFGGTFAGAVSSTQELRLYFGPLGTNADTKIFDSGALSVGVGTTSWDLTITIIRETSAVVRVTVSAVTSSTTLAGDAQYTRVTGLTLTANQFVTLTGTAAGVAAASNQITASEGYGQYAPSS